MVRAVLRGEAAVRDAIWRDPQRLDGIARAAQGGDGEADEALFVILRPGLERIAAGMGIPPGDIPDVVQETLVAVHLNLHRFDPARGSARTWATTILARLRLNMVRRRARRVRCLESLIGPAGPCRAPRTGPAPPAAPGAGDVAALLAGLTRRQRQVVAVYAIGGLSALEAGRVLGLSPAGVRSIARDARNRLVGRRIA
jgi:RNA polymerase sigma-70 factor (ECF subfamily)